MLALAGSLPESAAVRHDVRLFVGSHVRAVDRVLREAASPGVRDWSPGEPELEQVWVFLDLSFTAVMVLHGLFVGTLFGGLRVTLRLAGALPR